MLKLQTYGLYTHYRVALIARVSFCESLICCTLQGIILKIADDFFSLLSTKFWYFRGGAFDWNRD